jgi:hypothetical protein
LTIRLGYDNTSTANNRDIYNLLVVKPHDIEAIARTIIQESARINRSTTRTIDENIGYSKDRNIKSSTYTYKT